LLLFALPAFADAPAEWFAKLAPSTARVEFTLKHDDDTPPPALRAELSAEFCENCGEYHYNWLDGETLIHDERPFETMGWVVAPDTVLLADPALSSRFIASIHVALPNNEKIAGRAHAIFEDFPWMLVKTDAPLPGAQPLVFPNAQPPPQKGWLASFSKNETEWQTTLEKNDLGDTLPAWCGRRGFFTRTEHGGLFLAEDGTPAGFLFEGNFNPEKPLHVPPFNGANLVPFDTLAETETRIAALCGKGVHLATLTFRSPRKAAKKNYWDDDGGEESTVQYATAYHLAPGKFLIPWEFKPGQIARLETITLRNAEGGEVPAEFSASLENMQALIAVSRGIASAPLAVWEGDMRDTSGASVLLADITTHGGEMVLKHNRTRVGSMENAWKNFYTVEIFSYEDEAVFNARGELLSLPVLRLFKTAEGGYYDSSPKNFPAAMLAALVANPPESEVDTANVPVSEREENRVAWIGVELQPLSAELARELKITRLTQSGTDWRGEPEHGGAVAAFVYPGSPAEKAGVKAGDVLLRYYIEGRPVPRIFEAGDDDDDRADFPWPMYDRIPVEYFEHVPMPWPPARNDMNVSLTYTALGKSIRVAGFSDGAEREFVIHVELSPDTYESAPQFEADALDLHARDLTFEVRRYFRREADDPGVIISRVEPGGHAAVAGIKPFEIIVKVNDAEVRNVAELEENLRDVESLRLTVRRFNRERIVRVNLAKEAKPRAGLLNTLRGLVP